MPYANPADQKKNSADYYQKNRDAVLQRMRAYRAANPDKLRAYRDANLERERERCRVWLADHTEWRREYHRDYRRAHRAENRVRCSRRRAIQHGASGSHTTADVAAQYARQRGRCYWCGEKVDSSYHEDHVLPLSKGGSDGLENTVIACPMCNVRKQAQHPMDFAGVLL